MVTSISSHATKWEIEPRPNTIGLALGGGAARGIAHIGVLQVLEGYGIVPDYIAGTSIGSLIGGMYAASVSPTRMEVLAEQVRWRNLVSLNIPTLSLANLSLTGGNLPVLEGATGLLDIQKLVDWIESVLGDPVEFADLKLPFAAIATDLMLGETLALNTGRIAPAIHASCAVPGIFTPVLRNGRSLVDGGVSHNLPTSVVRDMGADYVIAIDLLPTGGATVVSHDSEIERTPRHLIDILMYALYALIRTTQRDIFPAECVITPQIGHISFTDLNAHAELIALGRVAAEEAVPGILRDLGRL